MLPCLPLHSDDDDVNRLRVFPMILHTSYNVEYSFKKHQGGGLKKPSQAFQSTCSPYLSLHSF